MHPIENIMKSSMEQIKGMVDVNTIVGTPIVVDPNTLVVPVSKVSLGFHSGGGEYSCATPKKQQNQQSENADPNRYPFAGTAAAGMSITPMAFISICNSEVSVKPVQYDCTIDRLVELIPRVLDGILNVCGCKNEQAPKNEPKTTVNYSNAECSD